MSAVATQVRQWAREGMPARSISATLGLPLADVRTMIAATIVVRRDEPPPILAPPPAAVRLAAPVPVPVPQVAEPPIARPDTSPVDLSFGAIGALLLALDGEHGAKDMRLALSGIGGGVGRPGAVRAVRFMLLGGPHAVQAMLKAHRAALERIAPHISGGAVQELHAPVYRFLALAYRRGVVNWCAAPDT